MVARWAAGGTTRNYRGILGKIWIAGLLPLVIPLESGTFQNLPRFLVLCKLSDAEESRSEVEDDHGSPCGETAYQGHELFGLEVQAFVDARISTEALLHPDAVESILKVLDVKAGWIQEDESKLLLRKALFSVERGKDESLRQDTTRRLAQIEAASAAALVTMPTTTWCSAEGRRDVDKTVRKEPQHTLEWRSSTTLREHSTCWTWKVRKASSRQL